MKKFFFICGISVILLTVSTGCVKTQCSYTYSRWLRENSDPINHVREIKKVNGKSYIITRDTVLGVAVGIQEIK